MGRPLIEYLEAHPELDVSSVLACPARPRCSPRRSRTGSWSGSPNLILTDSIGSSERGFNGIKMVAKGETADERGGPTVTPVPTWSC